jgi:hypothetical protein
MQTIEQKSSDLFMLSGTNEAGQVVGWGYVNDERHPFRLSPV